MTPVRGAVVRVIGSSATTFVWINSVMIIYAGDAEASVTVVEVPT